MKRSLKGGCYELKGAMVFSPLEVMEEGLDSVALDMDLAPWDGQVWYSLGCV